VSRKSTRPYATAQQIGGRSHQCDATAVTVGPDGLRAYALLDGIGDREEVRAWTRVAARRLARSAARRGDAEAGLRAVYAKYAAEPARQDPYVLQYLPAAAAIVAVTAPGQPLYIAWSGDARAYVLTADGTVQRLTQDHNRRRVFPPDGSRGLVTSYLGSPRTDEQVLNLYGHAAIESATRPAGDLRLLLASDGAYEPAEDLGCHLEDYVTGELAVAARDFVEFAVVGEDADNATVLVADLTA
jgi:serine/threonine protein phosphatase PrpC